MGCSKCFAITLGVVLGLTAIVCVTGLFLGANEMAKAEDFFAEQAASFEAFYWKLFDETEAFALKVKETVKGPMWESTKEKLHEGMDEFSKAFLVCDGAVLLVLSTIVLLTCIFCSFVLCCKNKCVQITAIILNVLLVIAMIAVVALTWSQHAWENVFTKGIWAEHMNAAIDEWRNASDELITSYNTETSKTVTIACKDNDSCRDKLEEYLMLNLQHLYNKFGLAFIFVLAGLVVLNVLSCVFARKRDEE